MTTDIVIFRRFPDGDVIARYSYLPSECLNAWPCRPYSLRSIVPRESKSRRRRPPVARPIGPCYGDAR